MQEILNIHKPKYQKLLEEHLKDNTPSDRLFLKTLLQNLLQSSAKFSGEPNGYQYQESRHGPFNIGHIFALLDIIGNNTEDMKFIFENNEQLFHITVSDF